MLPINPGVFPVFSRYSAKIVRRVRSRLQPPPINKKAPLNGAFLFVRCREVLIRSLWFDPSYGLNSEGTLEHCDDGPEGVRSRSDGIVSPSPSHIDDNPLIVSGFLSLWGRVVYKICEWPALGLSNLDAIVGLR